MKFTIEPHQNQDKYFHILGPNTNDKFIRIINNHVDFNEIQKIVNILNDNWDKTQYSTHQQDRHLANWLRVNFLLLTEQYHNSEQMINLEINRNPITNSIHITFDVDCNDYGIQRGGNISIIANQVSNITLPEIIEFCGIEDDLHDKLTRFLQP